MEALEPNAEPEPPHGRFAQAVQGMGGGERREIGRDVRREGGTKQGGNLWLLEREGEFQSDDHVVLVKRGPLTVSRQERQNRTGEPNPAGHAGLIIRDTATTASNAVLHGSS